MNLLHIFNLFLTMVQYGTGSDGEVSLSVLGKNSQWSPAITLEKLMLSIASMLDEPNPKDPLRPELAQLYSTNKDEYKAKAKACTEMYAMDLE